ncbi:type II toxin-antitoxin system YhaV family toxin [Anabaena sp. UHCC 0204]|uniref:type II toxin-antitoxin system YhaV family toxin n=1 Tax=Anabaena sp. UHCC 0204 TaxID=2590009 RepID=UPI0014463D52|nr:type II toxin-antitoxin system YhaV family toxin [Anabaena sp. UHCC 0204]MDK2408147.1 type II toxin-antitoxin system YhaV family toxin [Aphanizomenon sp. 202]MDK2459040.1 type II toxin-antitoxin system YhaV family toxin [Aphanizomenon sp. PH219]MTJ10671.1 type II toxin-antitoxin system YhaV family toxin [Anabaena sp. UHCC 0204]
MAAFTCNGWQIFFYPLFNQQWVDLRDKVKKLKNELPQEEFIKHPDAKLLKALNIGIKEKIPQDPFASHFVLQKPLQKYGRLKKMGLPERYRLFFRPFKEPKIIIILWLGFPRKEGDKKDCYEVFTKRVENGDFPDKIEQFMIECNLDNPQ